MRIHELVTEAVYDDLTRSLVKQFPDRAQAIDRELTWAKTILKRPDAITWYMLLVRDYVNNRLGPQLGNYSFKSLDQLHHDLAHYYGYNVPAIENYSYQKQTVGQVIQDLSRLLNRFQQEQEKNQPVTPQEGDRVLIDFGSDIQWWWVNKAYCSDEGRSGRHCGNIEGKFSPGQRILSLRKAGHVLLTFILLPRGKLGEMKARGNQKPAARYHPYIARLLMERWIRGITGGGFRPDANFSMFDFDESTLAFFDQNKPELIQDQCRVTPVEILKAPRAIQQKYRPYIANSGVRALIDNNSMETWSQVVKRNRRLILFAPHDMPDFESRLLNYCTNVSWEHSNILSKAPDSIARNYNLLEKIIQVNPLLIAGVSPSVRGYRQLCINAIQQRPGALSQIPEQSLDRELCMIAVKQNGRELKHVPQHLRDRDMCEVAIKNFPNALSEIPVEIRDRNLCQLAVGLNGITLVYVPHDLIDRDLCLTAVANAGQALYYVPIDFRDREICMTAVKQNGEALASVPRNLQDQEICQIAVANAGQALEYVPLEHLRRPLCKIAVQQDGRALRYVPERFRDRDMCLTAVAQDGWTLIMVPKELRDREMCETAVEQDGSALAYVPQKLKLVVGNAVRKRLLNKMQGSS